MSLSGRVRGGVNLRGSRGLSTATGGRRGARGQVLEEGLRGLEGLGEVSFDRFNFTCEIGRKSIR